MPRLLKWGILGTSTIILSKEIDKYAFMCGSNFYETDVRSWCELFKIKKGHGPKNPTRADQQKKNWQQFRPCIKKSMSNHRNKL